jgi:hypothetical protein
MFFSSGMFTIPELERFVNRFLLILRLTNRERLLVSREHISQKGYKELIVIVGTGDMWITLAVVPRLADVSPTSRFRCDFRPYRSRGRPMVACAPPVRNPLTVACIGLRGEVEPPYSISRVKFGTRPNVVCDGRRRLPSAPIRPVALCGRMWRKRNVVHKVIRLSCECGVLRHFGNVVN